MTLLENRYLKVSVRNKGAELTSIFNKLTGIEHIWQGNPDIWGWHAPNLFPVVGGCINNAVLINGQSYPMKRHGFTRDSDFQIVEADSISAKFSLPFSSKTLESFPYQFELQILYHLFDNVLRIEYKVVNLDEQTIYFGVGGHPAFNVPFNKNEKYEDYFLEFESPEKLERHTLDKEGLYDGKTELIAGYTNTLNLTKDLFDKDALVFKDLHSKKISLKSRNHDNRLEITFPHFQYLGLWAKPGATFVCIEPWLGCADTAGNPIELRDKEGIQHVDKGHVYEVAYTIAVF